jgi:calcyclin binding protein
LHDFAFLRKLNESADPQDGLMSLLKDMYSDGDDEMKRTIAQAWSKSQQQNPAEGMDMGL